MGGFFMPKEPQPERQFLLANIPNEVRAVATNMAISNSDNVWKDM